MSERPLEAAREGGLIRTGEPLLVLLSGGGDSVCLLDVAVRLGAQASRPARELRPAPRRRRRRGVLPRLCERLGVPLAVERVELPPAGNLQAAARDARYALAERRAEGDYAAAHTATDQAETVLYRLAVSPGRRALLGMEPRRGRLVRPLLEVTREEVREYCAHAASSGARTRRTPIRASRAPAFGTRCSRRCAQLSPPAERTIAETARQLREEAEVLDTRRRTRSRRWAAARRCRSRRSTQLPAGLRRLVLRRLAEVAAGQPRSLSRRGGRRGRSRSAREGTQSARPRRRPAGGGRVRHAPLRAAREDAEPPDPVELPVPGQRALRRLGGGGRGRAAAARWPCPQPRSATG